MLNSDAYNCCMVQSYNKESIDRFDRLLAFHLAIAYFPVTIVIVIKLLLCQNINMPLFYLEKYVQYKRGKN